MARGFIKKRGSVWYAILPYTASDGHKTKLWRRTDARTKDEANTALVDLLYQQQHGVDVRPDKLTVAGYFQHWLTAKSEEISPYTLSRYEQALRIYVTPLVGSLLLRDLKPAHVQQVRSHLSERLKGRTAHLYFTVFKSVLKQAEALELIPRSPATAVRGPKVERQRPASVEPETLQDILAAADVTDWREFVRLAVATGMRRGELLALAWDDIDFKASSLAIRKAKTRAGERTLALGPDTIAMLRALLRQQREWRLAAYQWTETGRVFVGRDGRPRTTSQANKAWADIRRQAGVEGMKFHDLRHAHVSLLLDAGVDMKVIQERVGHTSIRITMDVYGHIRRRADENAALVAEEALK